nr:energy transducer TonB [Lysobacter enzymogenes]
MHAITHWTCEPAALCRRPLPHRAVPSTSPPGCLRARPGCGWPARSRSGWRCSPGSGRATAAAATASIARRARRRPASNRSTRRCRRPRRPTAAPPGAGAAAAIARSGPVGGDERPQLVENPSPPPPPQASPSAPAPAPAAPTGAYVAAAPLSANRAPQYPPASLRRGEGGTVRVQVRVNEQGEVDDAEVVQGSGVRALDRAAVSAVRAWRFRPATRGGRPAADTVIVPITFNPNQ